MTSPGGPDGRSRAGNAWVAAMPAVFVLVWSTGFVVARFGMPHAGPMWFLAWRYAASIAAFALWIAIARAPWPRGRTQWLHLAVTGILMHGLYLGGIWAAVRAGVGAGTSALVVGLQPVLTAIWVSAVSGAGPGHEHRVAPRQWLGLALGLAGLTLVVWRKLGAGEVTALNLSLCVMALLAITTGTLYQKRFVQPCDVRTANTVQLAAALAVTAPLAWLEELPVRWHPELFGAMVWSVLGLTLGGSSLLFILIQRGAATRVSSLLYLVPPCTAVMAWALFGEALGPLVLAGLAITATGVWLVVRAPVSPSSASPARGGEAAADVTERVPRT